MSVIRSLVVCGLWSVVCDPAFLLSAFNFLLLIVSSTLTLWNCRHYSTERNPQLTNGPVKKVAADIFPTRG